MLISLNNINSLYIIVLIIILVYLLNNQRALELFMNDIKKKVENFKNIEHFYPSIFRTDLGIPLNFHNCTPENDCFPGSTLRTQIYQNVCQPRSGLLRQPIPLADRCQRGLGKMTAPRSYFVCDVDNHLQRKCKWIKH